MPSFVAESLKSIFFSFSAAKDGGGSTRLGAVASQSADGLEMSEKFNTASKESFGSTTAGDPGDLIDYGVDGEMTVYHLFTDTFERFRITNENDKSFFPRWFIANPFILQREGSIATVIGLPSMQRIVDNSVHKSSVQEWPDYFIRSESRWQKPGHRRNNLSTPIG